MGKLEMLLLVVFIIMTVWSFLQSHWLVAAGAAALLGLFLWGIYALLSHVHYMLIPIFIRW